MGSEVGWANLKPQRAGEPGHNSTGINQYTYRADAEKHLDAWCKKHGRALVDRIANDAKAGKPWAAKLLLDRILPTVQKHEVEIPGVDSVGLGDALAAAAKSRRSNGHDRDACPGANGGGA